jgi:hypothetical protein
VGGSDTNHLCVSKCGTWLKIYMASPLTILPMTAAPPPYLELVLPPPLSGDVYDLMPPITPLSSPQESPCSTPPFVVHCSRSPCWSGLCS